MAQRQWLLAAVALAQMGTALAEVPPTLKKETVYGLMLLSVCCLTVMTGVTFYVLGHEPLVSTKDKEKEARRDASAAKKAARAALEKDGGIDADEIEAKGL